MSGAIASSTEIEPFLAKVREMLKTGIQDLEFKGGIFKEEESRAPKAFYPGVFDILIHPNTTTYNEKNALIELKNLCLWIWNTPTSSTTFPKAWLPEIIKAFAMVMFMFERDKTAREAGKNTIPYYPAEHETPKHPMPKCGPYLNFYKWVLAKLLKEIKTRSYKNGVFSATIADASTIDEALNILYDSEHTTSDEKTVFKDIQKTLEHLRSLGSSENENPGEQDLLKAKPALAALWEVIENDENHRKPYGGWEVPEFSQSGLRSGFVFETYVFEKDGTCTITIGGNFEVPPGAPEEYVKAVKARQENEMSRSEALSKGVIQVDDRMNAERARRTVERMEAAGKAGDV